MKRSTFLLNSKLKAEYANTFFIFGKFMNPISFFFFLIKLITLVHLIHI